MQVELHKKLQKATCNVDANDIFAWYFAKAVKAMKVSFCSDVSSVFFFQTLPIRSLIRGSREALIYALQKI